METDNEKYCVYMHKSKIDNRVYIGITKHKNPECRWKKGDGYRGSKLFYNYINKYGWDILEHIVLYSGLSKSDAEQKEIELIKICKANDKRYGFNIANGGSLAGKHTEETRKKISENHADVSGINNPNHNSKLKSPRKPMIFTDEQRKKISSALRGRIFSEEWKNKIRIANSGRVVPPERIERMRNTIIKKKINCKPVIQCDLHKNYIKKWNSIKEASETLGVNYTSIASCCNNRRKRAGDFIWEFT